MHISFDLDDTIVCYQENVPQELNRVPWFLQPWIHEPLRLGTVNLIHTLQYHGFEIYIYTSSLRSPFLICFRSKIRGRDEWIFRDTNIP